MNTQHNPLPQDPASLSGLQSQALAPADERIFLRNVFGWMTLGVLFSAGASAWMVSSSVRIATFANNTLLWLGLVVAELVMVIALSAAIQKLPLLIARILFLAYALLTGVTLSVLIAMAGSANVAMAFVGAAGVFGGMAAWGWTTKKSLEGWGPVLFGSLIGLLLANIVYMFTGGAVFNLILGCLGVFIFAGFTAWDMKKIRQLGNELQADSDQADRMAILGALALYLDFVNLFVSLLRIFASSR